MGVIASNFSYGNLQSNKKQEGKKNYILLDYNDAYETRVYESQYWISTTVQKDSTNGDICQIAKRSSKKLRQYLQGKNKNQILLGDPSATICKILHPVAGKSDVTVSMVMPIGSKDSPPQPGSSEVFIEEQRKRLIYAVAVSKSSTEDDWYKTYCETTDLLGHNEESYFDGIYYRVTYANKTVSCASTEVWIIGEAVDSEYVCLSNDEELNEES